MEFLSALQGLGGRVSSVVREGVVSEVYPKRHSCRVTFEDKSGLVSAEMPILIPNAYKNLAYNLVDVDERVVCLMASNDLTGGNGYVIGSLYTGANKPAENNPDLAKYKFEDGTFIEYDRKEHRGRVELSDGAHADYKAEKKKSNYALEFTDGTKFEYSAEEKTSNFKIEFKDGMKISYALKESGGVFEMEFTDGANLQYNSQNSKFNVDFADGSELEHNGRNGNMTLSVTGNLEIEAGRRINISAGGDVEVQGANIRLN